MKFIKRKTYADTTSEELEELDMLASLLSQNPTKDELMTFYRNSKTLRISQVERDPYSFVFMK